MEFLTIKCQILHTHIGTLDTSEAAFWYFLPHSMMNLGNNLFDGYGFLALDVIETGRKVLLECQCEHTRNFIHMDVLTGLITCSKVEFFAITNCIDNVWDETLWIFTCSLDCRNIEMPVSEVVLIRSNELTQHAFADGIVVRSSTH